MSSELLQQEDVGHCETGRATSGVLQSLRKQVARLESSGRCAVGHTVSCGSPLLDQWLPGGGLAVAAMHEWVEHGEGNLAGWLALMAASRSLFGWEQRRGGRLVVLDREGTFYPPAALALGIPRERLIVVRPRDQEELIWSADQALRSPAVAAVWARLDVLEDRDARRLQLAAEAGGSLGLWVRPQAALRQPSWADVRWYVRGLTFPAAVGQNRRMELRLVRCRGGRAGANAIFEIDSQGQICHESKPQQTPTMPLVAQLAHPKNPSQPLRRRA